MENEETLDRLGSAEIAVPTALGAEDPVPAAAQEAAKGGLTGDAEGEEIDVDDDQLSVASEELEIDIREKFALLPEEALKDLSAETKLSLWYSWLPSIKADAVDELGANDSCLISVEGLILRYAAGQEYRGRFAESPQFLRLQYAIEKLLADLNDVGVVNTTLVFFDCFKGLLVNQHASLWAFRESFRAYCELNRHTLASKRFASWYDKEYSDFITARCPFVFFMEDGSALDEYRTVFSGAAEEADDEDANDKGAASAGNSATDRGYTPLYGLMLDTILRGINIACFYKLAFSGRRIKTFCILPQSGMRELAEEVKDKVIECFQTSCAILDELSPQSTFDVKKWSTTGIPIRMALFAACARETLGTDTDTSETDESSWALIFFKVLMLHDFILRSTPIKERPLCLAEVECFTYSSTMEFLFANLTFFLANMTHTMKQQGLENLFAATETQREIADLLDERMIRAILFALFDHTKDDPTRIIGADFFGIPPQWVELLNRVWSTIQPNKSFFPLKLHELFEEDGMFDELKGEELLALSEEAKDETLEKPKVLMVENNDYLYQMLDRKAQKDGLLPDLMDLETDDSLEGERRMDVFLQAEQTYDERLVVGGGAASAAAADKVSTTAASTTAASTAAKTTDAPAEEMDVSVAALTWNRTSSYDVATHHVQAVMRKGVDRLPKWIEKKKGEERERALRRWRLRREQEGKLYARNINKYFGGLDKLHLPIVLVGGHAAADHPWVGHLVSAAALLDAADEDDDDAVSAGTSPKASTAAQKKKDAAAKKETATTAKKESSSKKLGGKAAAIIEKNKERQAVKMKAKEEDVSENLYSRMGHMFKKRSARPAAFCDSLLELLVGSRNANDSTVLEDFGAIRKVLSLPENQAAFLAALGLKLMDPLEHTWRRKQIIASNQVGEMLKLIGLVFRFVQLSVDKHYKVMTPDQIKVFQTLLLRLGFKRSARATFELWAQHQLDIKQNGSAAASSSAAAAAATAEAAAPAAGGKKGAKPTGKAAKATAAGKASKVSAQMSESQIASYKKKLESEGFVNPLSVFRSMFDFAINPEREATFQVQYLGPDMERTLGSRSDPRVTFRPDAWQKRLLDIVDSQESCLVVAPTASGKTFAAYYAMDKVLRYDNESCVLFISPTRALALQVEAEVVARFSGKTYPQTCKTVLCGHLFEDRQDAWNNCQILITVPSCLEAVLSSTNLEMKEWAKKLKYAIMDEIHCIGEEKTGKDWENLIQLLPCPFMALSATVGNESDFRTWLKRAQSMIPPRPVRFIKHGERYADLQTLYYSSSIGGNRGLYNLNPLLCLDFERVKAGALGGDFYLIPTDLLATFDGLRHIFQNRLKSEAKTISKDTKDSLQSFIEGYDPEFYFQSVRAITKKQYCQYLYAIYSSIERLAQKNVLTEQDFESLIQRLGQDTPLGAIQLEPWWVEKPAAPQMPGSNLPPTVTDAPDTQSAASADDSPTAGNTIKRSSTNDLAALASCRPLSEVLVSAGSQLQCFNDPSEFLSLVRDLEARRLMPALVFNFNRAFASRLFYRVAHKLIDEHRAKYYGTPEATARTKAINKRRQDDYKAILARRQMAEKWKTLSKEQREEQGIDEQLFAELTGAAPPPPTDVAEEHDSEFFLCDKRMYASMQEEFDEVISMCKLEYLVKNNRVSAILLESLRRGIGLYHDALNREYRRAVELLFRMRYLRIVVSDSSLSLGINMPCKTTVFAGDSAMLTPLLYRQTSGRAGRRGFDSLGHIVFWEFPFKKVRRLLCSKLPTLSGNYPVRPTMVLKAMHLSQNLADECIADFAKRMLARNLPITTLDPATLQRIDISRNKLQKLFTAPLFAVGATERVKAKLHENTLLAYRFCVDLTRRLGLLNHFGHADGFATLTTSLGEDEPGNLFLALAIMEGALRGRQPKVLSPDAVNESVLDDVLVQLLAFTVKRRVYNHSIVRRFELASAHPELKPVLLPTVGGVKGVQETTPLLAPLPDELQTLTETFDRMIFDNAIARAKAMSLSEGEFGDQEYILPLSGVPFFDTELKSTSGSVWDAWHCKAATPAKYRYWQSPFAAVSGACDADIQSVEELVLHSRGGVFMEAGLVPQLAADKAEIPMSDSKGKIKLPLVNSYAADLLSHGKLRSIIECNDVPASEAYFILQALNNNVTRLIKVLEMQTSVQGTVESPDCLPSASACVTLMQAIGCRCQQIYGAVRSQV